MMFETGNIKGLFASGIKKIRNFLLSKRNREFLIFLLFLFISVCFWLLQTLKNDFEATVTIPVTLINVPKDVVITQAPLSELKVVVRDKGTVLLTTFSRKFSPITIDFGHYQRENHVVDISVNDFLKRIALQLGPSTKILSVKPDNIEFIYSRGQKKKVPVHFFGSVSSGVQYYVTDTVINPDSVTIYAPSHILKKIHSVNTVYSKYSNLSDTLCRTIGFTPIHGVKYDPQHVIVTFPVDILTEKTNYVDIVGVGFPPGKILRTFPSKVKVSFQVGLRRFRFIHSSDFVIQVSYNELIKNSPARCHLVLKSFPYGVSHVRIIPEYVDYLIEQYHP